MIIEYGKRDGENYYKVTELDESEVFDKKGEAVCAIGSLTSREMLKLFIDAVYYDTSEAIYLLLEYVPYEKITGSLYECVPYSEIIDLLLEHASREKMIGLLLEYVPYEKMIEFIADVIPLEDLLEEISLTEEQYLNEKLKNSKG